MYITDARAGYVVQRTSLNPVCPSTDQAGLQQVSMRVLPPNTIEMDADTWLALASGKLSWSDAMNNGSISASGVRADLTEYLPLGSDV